MSYLPTVSTISAYDLPAFSRDAVDVGPWSPHSCPDGAVLLGVHGVFLAAGSEHDIRPNGLRLLLADR